jgi:hypothetical protein
MRKKEIIMQKKNAIMLKGAARYTVGLARFHSGRLMRKTSLLAALIMAFSLCVSAQTIGDGPVITRHLGQEEIDSGSISFDELMALGQRLFQAKFNTFDGQGRPASTGSGTGTHRDPVGQPRFTRISAPDSNSCAGCHNDPFIGAAGDIVANVFVLAQVEDPVVETLDPVFSNSRNTLGMHGSGPIERLAVEMSLELQAKRDALVQRAVQTGVTMSRKLSAKGVSFGTITATPSGEVSGIEGVSEDLIIRPFHQKGAVISLRQFTNNAMNHHHGMQSVERFGLDTDPDEDGVRNELTVGDITAVSLWQAALGTPGQVIPNDPNIARAIIRGERHFSRIGCDDCHKPSLTLDSPDFVEPNALNPEGNLRPQDGPSYSFDMTVTGTAPRPERTQSGGAIIRAYTDLKRHDLCDDEIDFYCNEQREQDGISTRLFLTRKLWDVGNTAPYGHVGNVTTLTEAIAYHGGEARSSRDAFMALRDEQQDELIEFLKSLQILPPGTEFLVVDENFQYKNKRKLQKTLSDLPDRVAPEVEQ